MSADAFTPAEIESGRLLFTAGWRFVAAAPALAALPPMQGVEIAFAGRSNVGKSSLINALTNQRSLARTSRTPGRTQELIFFSAGGPLTLVDMPGYGYAQAPKTKVADWTALIHGYLRGRTSLARVYVLVDARHGLKPPDDEVFHTLDAAAVSYQVVLTKADQVEAEDLRLRALTTAHVLERRPAAFPIVITTSARTGAGLAELRAAIARLLAERG